MKFNEEGVSEDGDGDGHREKEPAGEEFPDADAMDLLAAEEEDEDISVTGGDDGLEEAAVAASFSETREEVGFPTATEEGIDEDGDGDQHREEEPAGEEFTDALCEEEEEHDDSATGGDDGLGGACDLVLSAGDGAGGGGAGGSQKDPADAETESDRSSSPPATSAGRDDGEWAARAVNEQDSAPTGDGKDADPMEDAAEASSGSREEASVPSDDAGGGDTEGLLVEGGPEENPADADAASERRSAAPPSAQSTDTGAEPGDEGDRAAAGNDGEAPPAEEADPPADIGGGAKTNEHDPADAETTTPKQGGPFSAKSTEAGETGEGFRSAAAEPRPSAATVDGGGTSGSAVAGSPISSSGRNPYLARAATKAYLRNRKSGASAGAGAGANDTLAAASPVTAEATALSPPSQGGPNNSTPGGDGPERRVLRSASRTAAATTTPAGAAAAEGDASSSAIKPPPRTGTTAASSSSSSPTPKKRRGRPTVAEASKRAEGRRRSDDPAADPDNPAALKARLAEKEALLDGQFKRRFDAETQLKEANDLLEKERATVRSLLTQQPGMSTALLGELAAQRVRIDAEISKRKRLEVELELQKGDALLRRSREASGEAIVAEARRGVIKDNAATAEARARLTTETEARRSAEERLALLQSSREASGEAIVAEARRGAMKGNAAMGEAFERLNRETAARKRAEERLDDALEWNAHVLQLFEYKATNGHADVPANHGGGRKGSLGFWVKRVRQLRNEQVAGTREEGEGLTEDQVTILESVGFWADRPPGVPGKRGRKPSSSATAGNGGGSAVATASVSPDGFIDFDAFFTRLMRYRVEVGDCAVPFSFDGGLGGKSKGLGYWAARVRKLRREQRDGTRKREKGEWLTDIRIEMLDAIDFGWYPEGGGSTVSVAKKDSKTAFANGPFNLRLEKAKEELEEEREWNGYFAMLLQHKAKTGDCQLTHRNGRGLRAWVDRLRQLWSDGTGDAKTRREGGLTDERVGMLRSIGFAFSEDDEDTAEQDRLDDRRARKRAEAELSGERMWSNMFLQLLQFKAERGDCRVPLKHGGGKVGSLGHWVARLRKFKAERGAGERDDAWLTDKRVETLEAVGFEWEARGGNGGGKRGPQALKADDVEFWNRFLAALLRFKAEHGSCSVPRNFDGDLKGGLGFWVVRVRRLKMEQDAGRREAGWLSNDRIEILNGAGFDWTIKRHYDGSEVDAPSGGARRGLSVKDEECWEEFYGHLLEFKAKHGDCRVGRDVGGGRKGSLGYWVKRQRILKQLQDAGKLTEGLLTEERIKRMEGIGFVFAGPPKTSWDVRFEELKAFHAEHGHACPQVFPKSTLGNWVCSQRDRHKVWQTKQKWIKEHGTEEGWKASSRASLITQDEIDKLESIGFVWTVMGEPHLTWDEYYAELVEYFNEHGHSNVPQSYKGRRNLGRWVMRQRVHVSAKQRGKLSADSAMVSDDRIAKLDSLNFCWNRLEHRQGTKRKRDGDNDNDDDGSDVEEDGSEEEEDDQDEHPQDNGGYDEQMYHMQQPIEHLQQPIAHVQQPIAHVQQPIAHRADMYHHSVPQVGGLGGVYQPSVYQQAQYHMGADRNTFM